jgi:RNase P subunit RPR2
MQSKTCTKCKQEKPLSAFGKRKGNKDGLKNWCKDCYTLYNKEWDHNHFERVSARQRKYKDNDKAREYGRLRKREERAKDPAYKTKMDAHNELSRAIKKGIIKKPDTCSLPGNEHGVRIESHHYDYSLPLDVIWLCSRCHTRYHRGTLPEDDVLRAEVNKLIEEKGAALA